MQNASGRRTHWAVIREERAKWKRDVGFAVKAQGLPRKPLKKARLVLTRASSSEPDFDGLVSGFKAVIDGLVEVGLLAGDKPSVIGQPEYHWKKVGPNQGYIRVEVYDES